jgi:hypothetical protein
VNNDQDAVDLAEAGRRLNLSVDAVRQRLKRGKLTGYKDGGKWYVYLDNAQTAPKRPTSTETEQTEQPQREAALTALQAHIDDLRGQIVVKDQEIGRLLELVHEAHALALPPAASTIVEPATADSDQADRRRPWWRVWG